MRLTRLVLAAAAGLLVAYDIWAVSTGGLSATISWTLYVLAQQWPILPFALGVIVGHIFWTNKEQ